MVKNPAMVGNRAAAPGGLHMGRDEQSWKNSQISAGNGEVGRVAEEPGWGWEGSLIKGGVSDSTSGGPAAGGLMHWLPEQAALPWNYFN